MILETYYFNRELRSEMMNQLIQRINELYKKSQAQGLTEAEAEEQARLRQEYINRFKHNLAAILDNTVIVHPDGRKTPVKRTKQELPH